MPPIIIPPPTPLFPAFPPVTMMPIYAWSAYTNPTQRITSTILNPRPLSDIVTPLCMIYYHLPANDPNREVYKTLDYGNIRPYTFRMPDGTTRINNTAMNQTAYNNLVANIWDSDVYPT